MSLIKRKNLIWFLPIFSGLILFFGYLPFSILFLPFIGLVPLLFFLDYSIGRPKRSFWAGFITGLFFFGGATFWMFDTLPLDWLNIHGQFLGFSVVTVLWLIMIATLSFSTGIFALVHSFLIRKNAFDILLIPLLWILSEFLGVWIFSIVFWGPEAVLGSHWVLSNLAYSVTQIPLLRIMASVGGMYLIGFLIVLVNVMVFHASKGIFNSSGPKRKMFCCLLICLIVFIFILYQIPLNKSGSFGQKLNIVAIQTKIPSGEKQPQAQNGLLIEAGRIYPAADIIVLPEGAGFSNGSKTNQSLIDYFLEHEIVIIDPISTRDTIGRRPLAVFYQTEGENTQVFQKQLLAPGGEYLPLFLIVPIRIIAPTWLERLSYDKGFLRGKETNLFFGRDNWGIGTIFCSESFSASLHRGFAQKDAKVFLNLANLSFARGSQMISAQTEAALRLRAAETGRYIIRVANYDRSYVIDERGEVIAQTSTNDPQIFFTQAPLLSGKTFYTKYGEWLLILAVPVLLLTKILNSVIIKPENKHLNFLFRRRKGGM